MNSRNNLIIVAHMDDEIFGMGGTLHKMKKRGDSITLVVAVNEGEKEDRREQLELISAKLEIPDVYMLGLSNATLDQVSHSELITGISQLIKETGPFTHCFTHSKTSGNQHHRKIAEIVETAARHIPNLLTFILPENRSRSLEFRPNCWEKLSKEDLNFKKEAGFIYGVYKPMTLRTPEAIDFETRCAGLECGIEFAEKFQIMRGLNE